MNRFKHVLEIEKLLERGTLRDFVAACQSYAADATMCIRWVDDTHFSLTTHSDSPFNGRLAKMAVQLDKIMGIVQTMLKDKQTN